MDKIVEITNLYKSYGDVKAVNGISFYIERGKLFSFLGPNGAGKSTTIDILCTLLKKDSGSVLIDGHTLDKDDEKIRSIIGVVFQDNMLDSLLTVKENLKIRASFYETSPSKIKQNIDRVISSTQISDFVNRPYGKLSGGQKRRCDIARALINTPKILFLDEPTTGLDPQTRKNVWSTIQSIQKETGMTILLTTHYMEEAASSDYVLVIDNGKIAAKGTPLELREKYSTDYLKLNCKDAQAVILQLISAGIDYEKAGAGITIKINSTMDALPILDKIRDMLIGFEVISGTMDDAFIGITGKEMRE
jgi:multidrug/hemolysin transport system ATP-binding protein